MTQCTFVSACIILTDPQWLAAIAGLLTVLSTAFFYFLDRYNKRKSAKAIAQDIINYHKLLANDTVVKISRSVSNPYRDPMQEYNKILHDGDVQANLVLSNAGLREIYPINRQ